jgi:two-component sensor histidine kinase
VPWLVAAENSGMLVEVNHRAKNSLAIATSLLAIQGRRQPDPSVRALFEEARERLNAMARVNDLLSKSEEVCLPGTSVRNDPSEGAAWAAGLVEALVRDDGVGLSQVREGSLGYGLVQSLVQHIRGEISIRNDAGLTVKISFPDTSGSEPNIRA